jgi:tape measure domain-containing protein
MPKSDYKIRLTARNETGSAFNKFKRDIDSTQDSIRSLRNQIIAAFGARELIQAGDTFVNLQNRMGALTGTAEGTAQAMAHMKRIALESRSDFDAVGDLFAKITFATKEMGLSQQQVADATQTVANTFIISGASAIEAANASRQLAQGLASGTLRGDELNSVMEQNSALAELLAKGLGVSTGQLREMGAAGKITAENILPTLISATAETSAIVGNMNMTIGQSISMLKTNFITLVGEVEKSTGIFAATANVVGFLSENIKILAQMFAVAFSVMVAQRIAAVAVTIVELAKAFKAAYVAGTLLQGVTGIGMVKIAAGIAAASAAIVGMNKLFDESIEGLEDMGDAATGLENIELSNFQKIFKDIKSDVDESIKVVKSFADTVEGQLTNAFQNFFDFTNQQFLNFKNLATSVARAVLNELINVFIVQKLVGMIKGSITDIHAVAEGSTAKAASFTNSLSMPKIFEGGGFTGHGARAGGVDGRGGFPAILHPNETVIDHTRGQGMGGATVNFNISTVDAAGFDELLASRKGMITAIINNAMNQRGKMGVV